MSSRWICSLLSLTVALAAAAPLVAQIPIPLSTKTDTLIIDNDGDGVADPGDTIRYSVVYTNAGTGNATNVFFTDALDANTTLAAGSVKTTPIARHDFYPVLGNVGLTVPAGSGLIAGLSPASADNDPDGGTVMANPVGSAATATSGTISIAADGSFTYDPPAGYEGSDSFVYGIIDDEGQTDQAIVFFTISDMVWFVDSSSGSGNGSFSSPFNSIADFNAIQGASIPNAKPGDAVFVYQGSGTYVNGTFLQNSQALLGQGVDLLTELASLLISVPAFSNLASSPPSGTAFRPTLTNAAGDGITLAQNNLIRGLDIGNTSGVGISDGGASVGSATIDQVAISGTGGGLEIDNGGSLAVTLDSLSASSSADEGIHLAGVGGAFAITATDGNISTSGVPAIVIDGNPSVAINITMTSVAANGAANGILIQDTTGSFTVTGSGSTDGSGGTIASITHRGGSFINASSISLSNMTFSNASTSNAAGNCTNLVNSGCNAAIHLHNTTNVDLANVDISTSAQQGINGLDVTNFTLTNSTLTGCGNEVNEGCLRMVNLSGTAAITNSDLSFAAERVAQIENTDVTLTLTVDGSTFRDTQSSGLGADGLEVTSEGASNTTIDVVNSSFLRNRTNGLQVFSEGTSSVSLDVTGSTFDVGTDNPDPAVYDDGIAMDLSADGSGILNFNVVNNPLISSRGGVAINSAAFLNSNIQGRINNNTITFEEDAPNFGGSIIGIDLKAEESSTAVHQVSGNTLTGTNAGYGIRAIARAAGTSRMDATLDGNNVTNIGDNGLYAIWVQASDGSTTCANVTTNTTSPPASGVAFRVRESSGTVLLQGFNTNATTTWNNNGNTPANSVSESPAGAASGGTCNTVTHATPSAPLSLSRAGERNEGRDAMAEAAATAPSLLPGRLAEDFLAGRLEVRSLLVAQESAEIFGSGSATRILPLSGENLSVPLGDLNAGQKVSIIFDASVDTSIPANVDQVCNQGLFTADNHAGLVTDDPSVGGASDPTCTVVEQAAVDLQIRKRDGGVSVGAGDSIAYTLAFTNTGEALATGVVITDTVPAHTTFEAGISTPGWSCDDGAVAGSTCVFDIAAVVGGLDPGAGGQVSFGVQVDRPIADGVSFIVNGAAIGDDGAGGTDPNPADNFSIAITPVAFFPDLQIRKRDGGVSVGAGDSIAYSLAFTNTGEALATGVVITDTVPANTTFDAGISTAGWSCADGAAAGTVCVFDVGAVTDLAPGAGGQVSFGVQVDRPIADGVDFIFNGAAIGDDGAGGSDPNPADNFSIAITPLLFPDLQIRKDDDGVSVGAGDSIAYTLTFTNTGQAIATGVVITDTVPANTTFDAAISTNGWSCDDGTAAGTVCVFDIGAVTDLAPGAGGQVSFGVQVDRPIADGVNFIVNGVAIGDDGAGGNDPNPADNFSIAITPLLFPDLQIRKDDDEITVKPGGTITYTVIFTNTGQAIATGVVITDTVPTHTTFDSAISTAGWSCDDGTAAGAVCVFDIGAVTDLAPGAGGQVSFGVQVDRPIAAGADFIVNGVAIGDDGAGGSDPNLADNFSIAITPVEAAPDLVVTKDDGVDFAGPGSTISYLIEYSNVGDRISDSTIISETVPAYTTFDPLASSAGWVCNPATGVAGTNCTINVGSLGDDDGTTTFAVTVDATIPTGVTETVNTVDIYGISSAPDSNPDDNSFSLTTVLNEPPEITAVDPISQTVQYSDEITAVIITATDSGPDDLEISIGALPEALSLTPAAPSMTCDPAASGGVECTSTVAGQMLEASGTYTLTVTVSDGALDSDPATVEFEVRPEDAEAAFDPDNPVGIKVASEGGDSGPFSLTVFVSETEPDEPAGSGAPGDIGKAVLSVALVPVGPGGPVNGTCVPDGVGGSGYDSVLQVTCTFDAVPVNTYTVEATVGGGYYVGAGEDVLTVYDPSLGFTTGGGWFYWPGTQDRTNLGYNLKYNRRGKNVQGSLLLIRHLPDGSIYRLKSNSLDGLAIGEEGQPDPYGWATFSGKATYLEPRWIEPVGNHQFIVYVEDHAEPGAGADRFWIEIADRDGNVIAVSSMDREAADNAVTLGGGNIVVPHTTGGGGGGDDGQPKDVSLVGRGVRLLPGGTTDVWALGDYAYLGTFNTPCGDGSGENGSGIRIFDISDPAEPMEVPPIPSVLGSRSNDVKVATMNSGDILVHSNESCAGGPGGFEVWNVDDPLSPVYLAHVGPINELNPISDALFGGITDVGVHNLWLFTDGNNDYVAAVAESAFDNLRIYDITDPTNPVRVAAWGAEELFDPGVGDETGDVNRVLDAALWLLDGFGEFRNRFLHDVTVSADGNTAVLSYWDAGFVTLDISDPANPLLISVAIDPVNGSLDGEVNSHAAWPSEDGSIVVEGEEDFSTGSDPKAWGGLRVWDTSDPFNPVLASTFHTTCSADPEDPSCEPGRAYSAHNIVVETNDKGQVRAYISWYADGMLVLDVTDPYAPIEIARYAQSGAEFEAQNGGPQDFWGVYKEPGSRYILGSDRNGGLYILADPGAKKGGRRGR